MAGEGLGRLTSRCVCVGILLWAGVSTASSPGSASSCKSLEAKVASLGSLYANAPARTMRWAQSGEKLAEAWSALADCRTDAKVASTERKKAIALRRAVLAGYPMHLDAARMLLAQTRDLMRLGRETEATTVARNLVRRYPQSKLVPDALVTLGDLGFSANDMAGAMRAYDAVVAKYPKSTLVPYATYKRSWCSFNVGDFTDALKGLVRVLQIAKQPNLVRSAQNDLVRAYAPIGKPSASFQMFKRWAPKRAFELTQRLAVAYVDMGKAQEAVTVYGVLVREARATKRHADVVAFRRDAISALHRRDGASSLVVKAVEKLLGGLAADLKGASARVKTEVRKDTRDFVVRLIAEVTAAHVRTREPHILARAKALRQLVERYLPGPSRP